MLPRAILHNSISLDGRIDGFPADLGQFYELAARWKEDRHPGGSGHDLSGRRQTTGLETEGSLPVRLLVDHEPQRSQSEHIESQA